MGTGQAGSATLVKNALAAKHPVAIEMAVRNGFETLGAQADAVDDDTTSSILGYHEVLAVGYDAAGLIIENSWGTGWANQGFGRLSWNVVLNDVWEADTIDGMVPPPPSIPSVSIPTVTVLATAGTGTRAKVSYKVAWKGVPGTSGAITRYEAWSSVDGHAMVAVKLASNTSTSFTLATLVGHRYRIAVRARAGTTFGGYHYTTTFRSALARRGVRVRT